MDRRPQENGTAPRRRDLAVGLILAFAVAAGGSLSLRAADDVSTDVPANSPRKEAKAADDFGVRQTGEINRLVREGWQAHGVAPSPEATDAEWCRRVYLD